MIGYIDGCELLTRFGPTNRILSPHSLRLTYCWSSSIASILPGRQIRMAFSWTITETVAALKSFLIAAWNSKSLLPPISCIRITRQTGLEMFRSLRNFERSPHQKARAITSSGFSLALPSPPATRRMVRGTQCSLPCLPCQKAGASSRFRTRSVELSLPAARTS